MIFEASVFYTVIKSGGVSWDHNTVGTFSETYSSVLRSEKTTKDKLYECHGLGNYSIDSKAILAKRTMYSDSWNSPLSAGTVYIYGRNISPVTTPRDGLAPNDARPLNANCWL